MPAPERLPFLEPDPWRVVVINPAGRYARNQVAGLRAAGTPLVAGLALGRNPHEYLLALGDHADTEAVLYCGEIGGDKEYALAAAVRDFPKPVVAMVVGRHAPAERRMGHAGALVGSVRESADAKLAALAQAGCRTAAGPQQAIATLKALGLAA